MATEAIEIVADPNMQAGMPPVLITERFGLRQAAWDAHDTTHWVPLVSAAEFWPGLLWWDAKAREARHG